MATKKGMDIGKPNPGSSFIQRKMSGCLPQLNRQPNYPSLDEEFPAGFRTPTSSGAPDRSRTCNLLIRSQVLYPLSYGRVA